MANLSHDITLCDDGVYRWTIARSMYRHPDALPTIYKAIGATLLIMWLLLAIIALFSANWQFLWGMTKVVIGIITPIFLVLTLLGYLIVAMMYGGKYHVVFEMHERMIVHRQINHSTKDSDFAGWMSIIAGTAMLMGHASPGAAMALKGIRANSKMVMKVQYKDVDRIQILSNKNTIRLFVKKWKYDIWTTPEIMPLVTNFLTNHCKKEY